jgi:hypothetical protein
MLQGNFATKKVTSLELEANSMEPSAFFLQRNKVLVKQELLSKVKATSENVMDFAYSHKTKGKTAIAHIGTMQSMVDFSSLCINMDTTITAICSNDGPQPILRQILLTFVAIVNNPDWAHWSGYGASQCGAQSNAVNLILRLFLYHFLHTMSS